MALEFLNTLASFGRVGRLPVSRWRMLATWAALRTRSRLEHGGGEATVLGRHVRCHDLGELSYLFYEVFVRQEYAFECAKASPLIYDLGGNIGMATLFFKALFPGARVRVYEPSPRSFALLGENVRRNALADVAARQAAIGGEPGTLTLYDAVAGSSLVSSVSEARAGGGARAVEVEAVRLSDEIDAEVDFLKMDIEGAETLCVEDLVRSGKVSLVREMAIEYHLNMGESRAGLAAFLGMLERAGFALQVHATLPRPWEHPVFQDVLVRAFRV